MIGEAGDAQFLAGGHQSPFGITSGQELRRCRRLPHLKAVVQAGRMAGPQQIAARWIKEITPSTLSGLLSCFSEQIDSIINSMEGQLAVRFAELPCAQNQDVR